MKIKQEIFHEVLNKFLSKLQERGIKSLEDIKRAVGKKFDFPGPLQEYVSIEERPSNMGTTAYSLIYSKIGMGIPVEIRINAQLNYSRIFIKTNYDVKGYNPFMTDQFENIAKTKIFLHCKDLSILLGELEKLKDQETGE